MTIDAADRRALLSVLERLEEQDVAVPRISGEIGMFIREWAIATRHARKLAGTAAPFVRGGDVGPVVLTPLSDLSERVLSGPLGDVASILVAAEELGTCVNVTLWGGARAANQALNNWVRRPEESVRLDGSYRWHAPRRLTPGAATVRSEPNGASWRTLRSLTAVAEDFRVPPAAADYRWDEQFGEPDFRVLRVVMMHRDDSGWRIIEAGVGRAKADLSIRLDQVDTSTLEQYDYLHALVVREPWAATWRAVAAEPSSALAAAAHLVVWADLRQELLGGPALGVHELRALVTRVTAPDGADSLEDVLLRADLRRLIHPRALPVAAWLRGLH